MTLLKILHRRFDSLMQCQTEILELQADKKCLLMANKRLIAALRIARLDAKQGFNTPRAIRVAEIDALLAELEP